MMRLRSALLALLCVSWGTEAVGATRVLFSGQDALVIIDGNGDGPGPGDCRYLVTFDGLSLVITPAQDANTPLKACSGAKFGSFFLGSDSSSDFAVTNWSATNAEPASSPPPVPPLSGLLNVPVTVELISEFDSQPPDGPPLEVNQITILDAAFDVVARTNLCTANGPAAQLNFAGGPSLLLQLGLFPNGQSPTHVAIPNLPFERATPASGVALLNAYLPLRDGAFTAALESSPDDLLIDVRLDRLAACAGRVAAPTMAEWALAALLLALLGFGTWRLSRRPAFSGALPRL